MFNKKARDNKNYNIKVTKLGGTLMLSLEVWQKEKINQFLGCVRKVKNSKIAQIHQHNNLYISLLPLFKEFKATHPEISNKDNPYRYIYPNQEYSFAKKELISFVGPLKEHQYEDIYVYNKHYIERVPAELYRNSMKELLDGNKKYVADLFNGNILYHNKRKPLRFIKKSENTGSLLMTSSDGLFRFIGNKLYIGKNIEKSLFIEHELKALNKQIKNHSLTQEERALLEDKIVALTIKLEKDFSYLGELKFYSPKKNKSYKEVDFNSVNSIRIKKNKDKYSVTFSYDCISEYTPCLFDLEGNEIKSKEELALYLKHLTETLGKQSALDFLEGKVLGIDRGINERLALSIGDKDFMSYEPEVKAYIKKLKKQIAYHNKQLKRRTKDSNSYNKSLARYRKLNDKLANVKKEINHQVSHEIITHYAQPIIAIEDLNIKGMTKRAKPQVDIKKSLDNKFNIREGLDELKLKGIVESLEEYYKSNEFNKKFKDIVGEYKLCFAKNKANAKSGLNESILTQNWGQFATYMGYKSSLCGKIMVEVNASYTSQQCSVCNKKNEKNRIITKFCCVNCGHEDHADKNASKVIASKVYDELIKYADKLLKDLSKKDGKSDKDKKSKKGNKKESPWDMGMEVKADGDNKVNSDSDISIDELLQGELSPQVCKTLQ
jgi:putative transposase